MRVASEYEDALKIDTKDLLINPTTPNQGTEDLIQTESAMLQDNDEDEPLFLSSKRKLPLGHR